eukprot:695385-Rhodomonas_salina.6
MELPRKCTAVKTDIGGALLAARHERRCPGHPDHSDGRAAGCQGKAVVHDPAVRQGTHFSSLDVSWGQALHGGASRDLTCD